jgi:integrase
VRKRRLFCFPGRHPYVRPYCHTAGVGSLLMRGTKRKRREGIWELRVYVGRDPATGHPKQVSKAFHGNVREADEALRDMIEQLVPGRSDGMGATFGQLLDAWLTECERLELSPTTLRVYRAQIERTIRPTLGPLKVGRIGAKDLDDLYGAMKAAGSSPKTIRNHHAIIAAALHQAVRWGWIRRNIAELAKPPRIAQRVVQPPSVDAVRDVVLAAEDRDPRLAPLLMLAALTGMRRGELCALRWPDVDLETAQIEVARSVVLVPSGLAEKSTKTNKVRHVALDEVGVAVLVAHRRRVEEWALAAEVELEPLGFVFSPYVDGSLPFRPDNVTGFFIRVRDELKLPDVRLHDLRHFTATQLIAAGVDVRTVAGRLGHSDPSLTLRVYSHALEERDRAAAAVMGRVLARRSRGSAPRPPVWRWELRRQLDRRSASGTPPPSRRASSGLVGTTTRRPKRRDGSSPRATRS